MKPAERLQGTALAGLAVKVTAGYFLIELSAADADKQRNLELLKGRPWIDIPDRLHQQSARNSRRGEGHRR